MAIVGLDILWECSAGAPEDHVYLFAVGGIGTREPREWSAERECSWLRAFAEKLAKDGRGCTVVTIRHGLSVSKLASWAHLLEVGLHVRDAINQFRRSKQITRNAILIASHSLAGFFVKQALVSACRSARSSDDLLSTLRGLLFVGCPQLHPGDRGQWQRVIGILLSETRDVDTSRLSTEDELLLLSEVSRNFGDASIQIPTLSLYETKQTKLKRAISLKSQKVTKLSLVDSHSAKTGLEQEELVAIDATHGDSCSLEDANVRAKVFAFLRQCLEPPQVPRQTTQTTTQSIPLPSPLLQQVLTRDSTFSSLRLSCSPIEYSGSLSGSSSIPEITGVPTAQKQGGLPILPCDVVDPTLFVDDFVARDDVLGMIDDALDGGNGSEDTSRVRYVALHGIGGIGKTSTAAQYWKTKGDIYEAKFWVRADHPKKLVEDYGRIAVALGLLEEDQTQDTAYNRKVMMDWLENPARTSDEPQQSLKKPVRWLIVFDNVEDIDNLASFWPMKGGGSIIVTSRNPTTAWRPQDAERRNEGIKMKPLQPGEATQFLQRLAPAAGRRRDPGAAAELADRLDCIPFTLRQMGSYVHRKQMTFRRFLEVYQDEATQGKMGRFRSKYDVTVLWMIEGLNEQTLSLLNLLALLDPDGINETVLMPGEIPLSDSLYPVNLADYEDAKAELSVSSLIINKNDGDTDDDQISVHRTVQDVVRAHMSPTQFHAAFQTAVDLLLHKWPVKGRPWHYPVDRWPHCEELSSHLIKLHSHYCTNCGRRECTSSGSRFAQLLIYGGWYWYQRGAPDQAKKFFDTSEQLANRLDDGETLLEDIWMCQGCLATETNNKKACWHYYSKFKESILTRVPDPQTAEDLEPVSSAHNEMGISHMMRGEVGEARKEFEIALSYSKSLQKDSETILSVRMFATANLGLVSWIEGRHEEALAALSAAYTDYRRRQLVGEKESFIPGRLMYAIGNVKASQGHHGEALIWHKKALNHYNQTIGMGHHRTADVFHKLAEDYIQLQRHGDASECIAQALMIFESKECYAPERARTTYLHGMLFEDQGNTGEANRHYETAYSCYKTIVRERNEAIPRGKLKIDHYNQLVTFWSR